MTTENNLPPIIEDSSETIQQVAPPPTTEKRGRGRPPGSGKKITEQIPELQESPVSLNNEKPRRGRPPGAGSAKKTTDIPALAKQLQFGHKAVSLLVKIPEVAIDDDEAKMLAESLANLMKEFDITVSGKTAAIMGMLGTSLMIYGPRFMYLKAKADMVRAQNQQNQIVDMPPNG